MYVCDGMWLDMNGNTSETEFVISFSLYELMVMYVRLDVYSLVWFMLLFIHMLDNNGIQDMMIEHNMGIKGMYQHNFVAK